MNVTRYKCSVLVVDDDPGVLSVLVAQLGADFEVVTACTGEQARGVLARRTVDMILSDLRLPDESGLALLDWVRRASPRTSRVLITGTARLEDAAAAINRTQVHRLVLKPWRAEDLLQTLRSAASALFMERSHEQLLEDFRRANDDLRKVNDELERRVAERTRELEAALETVRSQALTDDLTGLPNRRAVKQAAYSELARRGRFLAPLALALVDADHFKQTNTDHGWSGGDHVLRWLAGVLQHSVRASVDAVGRWGGEEFLVVAPGTDAAGAAVLAERLRAAVEAEPTCYDGRPIKVTISLGLAVVDGPGPVAFRLLLRSAEDALREAKKAGRNRAVVRAFVPPPPGEAAEVAAGLADAPPMTPQP
jgi:diguanylate cyclase (GGDEF)-like protein